VGDDPNPGSDQAGSITIEGPQGVVCNGLECGMRIIQSRELSLYALGGIVNGGDEEQVPNTVECPFRTVQDGHTHVVTKELTRRVRNERRIVRNSAFCPGGGEG